MKDACQRQKDEPRQTNTALGVIYHRSETRARSHFEGK